MLPEVAAKKTSRSIVSPGHFGLLPGGVVVLVSRVLSISVVVLTGFAVLSCGSNSSSLMGRALPNANLQSITLAPTAADAQAYANGAVPFVATGHYINPPHSVTPQAANWGACLQNAPTTGATVNQEGVAQCAAGATGKYTVFADVGTECNVITQCGGGCTIVGTAQLTCP